MIKLKDQSRKIDILVDRADVGDRQMAICTHDANAGFINVS